jgi:hypothetical protein
VGSKITVADWDARSTVTKCVPGPASSAASTEARQTSHGRPRSWKITMVSFAAGTERPPHRRAARSSSKTPGYPWRSPPSRYSPTVPAQRTSRPRLVQPEYAPYRSCPMRRFQHPRRHAAPTGRRCFVKQHSCRFPSVDTGFLDAALLVSTREIYAVDLLGPTR